VIASSTHEHRDPRTGPGPLRAVPHRFPPPGRCPHRHLQRSAAAARRRRLHPAHRGHRQGALRRRHDAADPVGPGVDRRGLGRGSVPAERADAAAPRAGRGAPRRRQGLPLLLHHRGAGPPARRGPGEGSRLPLPAHLPAPPAAGDRRPARFRRAVRRALPDAGRPHPLHRHRARRHGLPPGGAGRLHPPAVGRHADLPHVRRGGRHRHADQPRHPRRGPPVEHAEAHSALRGPGRLGAHLRPPAADPRAGQEAPVQALRRDVGRGVPQRGHAAAGALQLHGAPGLEPGRRPGDPGARRDDRPLRRQPPERVGRRLRPREAAVDERAVHGEAHHGRHPDAPAAVSGGGGPAGPGPGPPGGRARASPQPVAHTQGAGRAGDPLLPRSPGL